MVIPTGIRFLDVPTAVKNIFSVSIYTGFGICGIGLYRIIYIIRGLQHKKAEQHYTSRPM